MNFLYLPWHLLLVPHSNGTSTFVIEHRSSSLQGHVTKSNRLLSLYFTSFVLALFCTMVTFLFLKFSPPLAYLSDTSQFPSLLKGLFFLSLLTGFSSSINPLDVSISQSSILGLLSSQVISFVPTVHCLFCRQLRNLYL